MRLVKKCSIQNIVRAPKLKILKLKVKHNKINLARAWYRIIVQYYSTKLQQPEFVNGKIRSYQCWSVVVEESTNIIFVNSFKRTNTRSGDAHGSVARADLCFGKRRGWELNIVTSRNSPTIHGFTIRSIAIVGSSNIGEVFISINNYDRRKEVSDQSCVSWALWCPFECTKASTILR